MKRPWYLSTWLIIIMVLNLLSVIGVVAGSGFISKAMPNLPSWYMPLSALLGVAEVVGAVMIWQWKMMGFYLIVGIAVLSALLSIMTTGRYSSVIFGALGILILYFCMRPVWKSFK